ncbi:MAG: septum site-determining protein MinD [Limnochordaceae bacterium]|nr:septum site-determining protein MinD [Limnochordaceae bacterium]
MAGRVIVITSGKGGVGKTTTTANLGAALAQNGRRVVVVDADIGLRNLDVVLGLENRIVYDLVDVVEGNCKLKAALIRDKRTENLTLLPAAQTRGKDAVTPAQMRDLMAQLQEEFEYVLVDSPAGIDHGFHTAVAGATEAIIVTTPEVAAVRDADRVIGLLESKELYEPKLVINRIRPRMVRRGDMMEVGDVLEILAIPLIGIVPDDEEIIVTTNRGEPAVLDGHSRAGQAFRNIARRLEGQEVPFLELEDGSLMARLLKLVRGTKAAS